MDSLRQMNITGLLVLFLFNASLVLVVTGQSRDTSKQICQSSDELRLQLVKLVAASDGDLRNELLRIAQAASQCLEPVNFASSGWTLVFHGQAGVGTSVLDAYQTGKGIPGNVDEGCIKYDSGKPCTSHYRNGTILDVWRGVNEVLFVVYNSERKQVRQINFNAMNSDKNSWFQNSNVRTSDWTDLGNTPTDIFSIAGESSLNKNRHFFISHFNRECNINDGWFIALDSKYDECCMGPQNFPVFLYSSTQTCSLWNSNDVEAADAFEVYIKND
ncbi:unnamed protein product [Lymnaea stagnalis]|uniref:Uncharacterized protein n=1 Tax=Lymnaea stagnalis TaxID=6523 RepID=A0AAV2HEZ9_LYMST